MHGQKDKTNELTYLGGRNAAARLLIGASLEKAGFEVPKKTPYNLRGEEPANICNRCSSRFGVQLEITKAQRAQFFRGDLKERADRKNTTASFDRYVKALRAAVAEIENDIGKFQGG